MFSLCVVAATLSYAQEGTLTFPSPWDRNRSGSDGLFFGPAAGDSNGSNDTNGLLDFGQFPGNSGDFFGFDEFFEGFLDQSSAPETELLSPFQISETNGLITVQTDVAPGIELEEIGIGVEGDVLSVNVADTQITEETGENYSRFSWHRESITRTAPLPVEVNEDDIITYYEDGELTVTLPKDE